MDNDGQWCGQWCGLSYHLHPPGLTKFMMLLRGMDAETATLILDAHVLEVKICFCCAV